MYFLRAFLHVFFGGGGGVRYVGDLLSKRNRTLKTWDQQTELTDVCDNDCFGKSFYRFSKGYILVL